VHTYSSLGLDGSVSIRFFLGMQILSFSSPMCGKFIGQIYYVVHRIPSIVRVAIHLGGPQASYGGWQVQGVRGRDYKVDRKGARPHA